MNVHDSIHHVLYLGTAYYCYKRTLTTMGILVGDYCVQVTVRERRLINAEIRTYVTRKDKPLLCMGLMLPCTEITQVILVRSFKLVTLYMIRFLERPGRNRGCIQGIL